MARFEINFTALEITDETAAIRVIQTINGPKVAHLSKKQRHDERKMGTGNQGYVNNLFNIGMTHGEIIPSTFSMGNFGDDRIAAGQLINFRILLSGIIDDIDDTVMELGHNNMEDADAIYGFLKSAAKTSSTLKTLLDSIADHRKHSHTLAEEFTVPASSSVYKDGLKKGLHFANHGTTVFTLFQDHNLTGGVNIAPGDSFAIPDGWAAMTITNMSGTTAGIYSLA